MLVVDAPTLKRVCDNISLFLDKKARYLPDVALVELDSTGLALTGCDDYAIGRDTVPRLNGGHVPARGELAGKDVSELAKLAGKQGSSVAQDQGKRGMVNLALLNGRLVVAAAGAEHAYDAPAPTPDRDKLWRQSVDCLSDEIETGPMPRAVAWRPVRLHRMARVKGTATDDPLDVRIMPLGCDLALVKIGMTFRGALMLLDRQTLQEKYSDSAVSPLWS